MDVDIGEVTSTVRAVDGGSLLSPDVLRGIVRAVVQALEEKQAHEERVRAERRVGEGVSRDRDEEGQVA